MEIKVESARSLMLSLLHTGLSSTSTKSDHTTHVLGYAVGGHLEGKTKNKKSKKSRHHLKIWSRKTNRLILSSENIPAPQAPLSTMSIILALSETGH